MILSLGSINADFVVRTDAPPSGPGSLLARDLLRTSGGKAANVAVLAARLGAGSVLMGCVGDDDLAEQALAGPRSAGVDLTGVRRRPGPTGYSSVVVPPDGAKTIVLAPNANDAWGDDVSSVRRAVERAPDGSILVADLEIPPEIVRTALQVAHQRGIVTVIDPAPAGRLDDSVLPLVGHLTPDHHEAEDLTGICIGGVEDAGRAAQQLRGRGATAVHVKLGSGGCVTATPETLLAVEAPGEIDVVDATGAGDAFAGALAWALLGGEPLARTVEIAVAASTCAVTAYGSQESYPSRSELRAMLERVRSRPLSSRASP